MSKIKQFAALLPVPSHAKDVISPPYDVIDAPGARAFAKDNPRSFLHITRSEIDMPEDVFPYDDSVYENALSNLNLFQEKGLLVRDASSLYIYRQVMGEHSQTGVVALASVDEYVNGKIKRHELTREEKVVDRMRHADFISAHAEPVFLVHRRNDKVSRLVSQETAEKPLYDLIGWDGVRHIFWRVKEAGGVLEAFEGFDALYIADGHHRSESAARVRELKRGRNPGHIGTEGYNYFPVVIFSEDEVRIFEYKWDGDPPKRPLSKYSMADVMKLADEGGIMPPKSTWFAPKLSSGLFMHTF